MTVKVVIPSGVTADTKAKLRVLGGKQGAQTITLPITNPAVKYQNLQSNWQEVDRPGRTPLNVRVGLNLATVTFTSTIGTIDVMGMSVYADVESVLNALVYVARQDSDQRPLAFYFSGFESTLSRTGHWHLESVEIDSVTRQPGTNRISQATVSITLKEQSTK